VLRITEILADNAKPSIGPRPKREKVVAPPAEDGDEAPKPAKKAAAKKPVAKAKAAAKPRAKADAKKPAAKKAAAKGKSDKK
jgi:large subunit ribosomal protein L21